MPVSQSPCCHRTRRAGRWEPFENERIAVYMDIHSGAGPSVALFWFRFGFCFIAQSIERAGDFADAVAQHMGIDHGRSDIFMAQQLLDRADIHARFQQVSGERVPQGVGCGGFADARHAYSDLKGFWECFLTEMVASHGSAAWVTA